MEKIFITAEDKFVAGYKAYAVAGSGTEEVSLFEDEAHTVPLSFDDALHAAEIGSLKIAVNGEAGSTVIGLGGYGLLEEEGTLTLTLMFMDTIVTMTKTVEETEGE